MFLKLAVFDAHQLLRGSVRLRLDWGLQTWALEDDKQQVWQRVGYSPRGTFEVKSWGVIWLWDQAPGQPKHNTVIFWDAPKSAFDFSHRAGVARIFDPKDPAFKEGKLHWAIEKTQQKPALAPIRAAILEVCRKNLPAFPAPPKEPPNCVADKAGSEYAGVTNCGAFPGWIVKQIPGAASLVPDKLVSSWEVTDKATGQRVKKTGTSVVTSPMTAWEEFAKLVERRLKEPGSIWIPFQAGDAKRPQPGDFYVLAKSAGPRADFAHVGVMIDSRGRAWRTADAGQGSGFAVGYQTRTFDEQAGTLTLILNDGHTLPPDKGTRYLKGWVNIEKLFQGWKP